MSLSLSVNHAAHLLKLESKLDAKLTLREDTYLSSLTIASGVVSAKGKVISVDLIPALRGIQGPPGALGSVTTDLVELLPGQPPTVDVVQDGQNIAITFGIPTPNNYRLVTNAYSSDLRAGQPVCVVTGGGVLPAQANSDTLFGVTGIVFTDVIHPGQTGVILVSGIVRLASASMWDDVVVGGVGGLTAQQPYYLDWASPGKLNPIYPQTPGYYRVPLGIGLSPTELEVSLGYNIKL